MMENLKNPKINRLGERSILINWTQKTDENLLFFMLEVKKLIKNNNNKLILEVNNTYNSLLINYIYTINNFYDEKSRLKSLISTVSVAQKHETRLYKLPVCYDEKFGIDLLEVAARTGLSKPDIITLHTTPVYTIFFQGFLPGFLYLGGLDNRLKIARKKNPRLMVKKGAVGLAENQTGIYPQNSAGGWQIIGRCPLNFFEAEKQPPTIFSAGDQLKFQAVSAAEFDRIETAVADGEYKLTAESLVL